MINLKTALIVGVGVGMLAAASAYGDTFCQSLGGDRFICEGEPFGLQGPKGPAGPTGPQGPIGPQGPGIDPAMLSGIQSDISSNTSGVAAALSLSALQQNPNYEGWQTSFGVGYWDGKTGYGALLGKRLTERVYGNIGIAGVSGRVGAVMSFTAQW